MSELKPCPFCGEVPERVLTGMKMVKHYCGGFYDGWYGFNVWNRRPIEDELRAELARRDEQISTLVETVARLKEDGERLIVTTTGVTADGEDFQLCPHCDSAGYNESDISHSTYCPITLHRALMKELE